MFWCRRMGPVERCSLRVTIHTDMIDHSVSSSSLSNHCIRVLLVDDERIGRTRLRVLLEREPDLEIVAECADGPEAVEAIQEHRPDLLFLDINMPGMDGFDVLDELGDEQQPMVIFVTAYDEHAVRAFDACALDYLLKPVSAERLGKALRRARERLAATAANEPTPGERDDIPNPSRFVVRSGGRVSFGSSDEIDWVEAAGNYAIFHVGKHNHMVRETMNGLEARLPTDRFLRISRSAIVNLHRVKELVSAPMGTDAAVLADGRRIPMPRSLREVADRLAVV
jgi:two-component system LytT family response regulator